MKSQRKYTIFLVIDFLHFFDWGETDTRKTSGSRKSIKELKKEELKKIEGGSSASYPKNYSFSCKKMLDISYNIML